MLVLQSNAQRARRSLILVRAARDLCGQWPATARERSDATWANATAQPRDEGVKPSSRIAARVRRAAVLSARSDLAAR
jgi:hypothetical protein